MIFIGFLIKDMSDCYIKKFTDFVFNVSQS